MENPPDLIAITASDEQIQDKIRLTIENITHEQNKQHDESSNNFRSDKIVPQYPPRELRTELTARYQDEFDEQIRLLKQRFHDEIQSVFHYHKDEIQRTINDASVHVRTVLQKSLEDVDSLRLLHHRELCVRSKLIADCVQHQSLEMNELNRHLMSQDLSIPLNLFHVLLDDFQAVLANLNASFNSKLNYLNDLHSSTVEHLRKKHATEIDEMQCQLSLMSNG